MSKLKWFLAAAAAVVVLVVGGTWIYINVIREDAPPPLALDDAGTDTTSGDDTASTSSEGDGAASGSAEGTWGSTDESIAGYRVGEVLFGQSTEAVGRTNDVDGSLTIEGTTVTQADFEIDMTTVESDESRRDAQFSGNVMDVDTFPTATFELTEPIELDDVSEGTVVTAEATGDLTLRGTTQPVTIELEGRYTGDRLEVVGSLTIVFAEWDIPNPSRPGIDTEDQGLLEVLLVFARQ
jgi:polyisoprenoid-binding protein YceI